MRFNCTPQQQVTREDIAEMRRLRSEGMSTNNIAARLGVGTNTVWRYSPNPIRLTEKEKDAIIRLRADGLSIEKIAHATGRSRDSVHRTIREGRPSVDCSPFWKLVDF